VRTLAEVIGNRCRYDLLLIAGLCEQSARAAAAAVHEGRWVRNPSAVDQDGFAGAPSLLELVVVGLADSRCRPADGGDEGVGGLVVDLAAAGGGHFVATVTGGECDGDSLKGRLDKSLVFFGDVGQCRGFTAAAVGVCDHLGELVIDL